MSKLLSFKKLSLMVRDNYLLEPKDLKVLQENLKTIGTQEQALKTAVSMSQRGYDMGVLCSDILRIIDTSDIKLKILCNTYLRDCVMARPACQLLCTNTFLKDFNDRNWQIQRSAVNDAIRISDEIILLNYIYDLKKLSLHGRSEIRSSVAQSLGILYGKAPGLFFEHFLDSILLKLVHDDSTPVVIAALRTAAYVHSQQTFISLKEIVEIIKKYTEGNIDVLRAALSVLKHCNISSNKTLGLNDLDKYEKAQERIYEEHKTNIIKNPSARFGNSGDVINNTLVAEDIIGANVVNTNDLPDDTANASTKQFNPNENIIDEEDLNIKERLSCDITENIDNELFKEIKEILKTLIKSSDVSVFYLAANKLLQMDTTYTREVLEQAYGFLNLRSEQLYNLLLFIDMISDEIDFDPSILAIEYTDPEYIKNEKVNLFLKKRHMVSETILKNQILRCDNKINMLEKCIRCDFVMPELLDSLESKDLGQFFAFLLDETISGLWEEIIESFIYTSLVVRKDIGLAPSKNATTPYYGGDSNTSNASSANSMMENTYPIKSREHNTPNDFYSKEEAIGLALEVAGNICKQIPDWIFSIEHLRHSLEIVRFYCKMKERNMITTEQCVNYLLNLKKEASHVKRIKLIINNIEKVAVDDVCRVIFKKIKYFQNGLSPLDSDIKERSVMGKRPFKCDKTKGKHIGLEKWNPAKCFKIARELPIFIDVPRFKGVLDLIGNSVVLKVDKIEECKVLEFEIESIPGTEIGDNKNNTEDTDGNGTISVVENINSGTTMGDIISEEVMDKEYKLELPGTCDTALNNDDFICEQAIEYAPNKNDSTVPLSHLTRKNSEQKHNKNAKQRIISQEGHITLFEITSSHINKSLRLSIEECTYFTAIDIYNLIRPYPCDAQTLETAFSEIIETVVVGTFDMSNVFVINDTMFSFNILGNIFYGKSYSNEISLKGDLGILKKFKNLILRT